MEIPEPRDETAALLITARRTGLKKRSIYTLTTEPHPQAHTLKPQGARRGLQLLQREKESPLWTSSYPRNGRYFPGGPLGSHLRESPGMGKGGGVGSVGLKGWRSDRRGRRAELPQASLGSSQTEITMMPAVVPLQRFQAVTLPICTVQPGEGGGSLWPVARLAVLPDWVPQLKGCEGH